MTAKKLTRTDFETALKHGRGQAFMHVMEFGLDDISDILIRTCLQNSAYDPQCECDKSSWLYQMLLRSPNREEFSDTILAALEKEQDYFNIRQLCELTSLMARDGNPKAADRLRDFVLSRDFSNETTQLGTHALAMLDGVPAIVELAKRFGGILLNDSEAVVDPLDALTENTDLYDQALQAIEHSSKSDIQIATYLNFHKQIIQQREERQNKSPEVRQQEIRDRMRARYPLDLIIANAAAGKGKYPSQYSTFGRWATANELDAILEIIDTESSREALLRLLWVFRRAAPPRLSARIWGLTEDKDDDLRQAALTALSHEKDIKIGQFARNRLSVASKNNDLTELVEILINNFRDGDEELIMSAVNGLRPTEDEAHHLGCTILKGCKKHPSEKLAKLVEWTYTTTPCSICRHDAVDWLGEFSTVPSEIINECLYDADPDTQKMARNLTLGKLA